MYKNKGFTLIELIATFTVMAIITAMAAPSMANILSKQKLNSTTRELIETLNTAKTQAVLLRKDITVQLNSTATDTQYIYNWQPSAGNTLTAPVTIPSIIFTADGTLKNSNSGVFTSTNFVICNTSTNKSKTITLTRMGGITLTVEGIC
ncbi:GspH/FimT family pseudopilin [Acinetobacter sp. Marseille-Q1618]|uniref:GspH/FimT family pseudopilin n=1 Tax=Acinetobacter sp. Marseille-Q1618 TaxID=2697502 RepID=UPI00157134C5|nr:GspH/FimT family pseudopilin [Acinetobacter sp. Marseille-Q1618]